MLSELAVCYLFCGGAGAGACFVSAVMGLFVPRDVFVSAYPLYRKLFGAAFVAAFVFLLLGTVCLLADLGRIERVGALFFSPSLSYITLGTYALSACLVLSFLLALFWCGFVNWSFTFTRLLQFALVFVSLIVMTYTGLLLQSVRAVPLWNSPILVILFVLSSLSCGCALVLGIVCLNTAALSFGKTLRVVLVFDLCLIALEFIVFLALMAGVFFSDPSSASTASEMAVFSSVDSLVLGNQALMFWGGFVCAGIVLPFVCEVCLLRASHISSVLSLVASVSVLVGGYALRGAWVFAGMLPILPYATIG